MAAQGKPGPLQRPKGKTPAERSEEFDEIQARLRAEAAERRKAAAAAPAGRKRR